MPTRPTSSRQRRFVLGGLAGTVLLTVPLGLHAANAATLVDNIAQPTTCAIDQLPVPPQAEASWATGSDESGRYLTGQFDAADSAQDRALLWVDGEVHPVDLPGGGDWLKDANAEGRVIGTSDDGALRPNVYQDGELTALPITGTNEADLAAINPNGDIAGTRLLPPDPGNFGMKSHPVRWRTETANGAPDSYVMEPLSVPEDTITVEVGGIADDGTVVGVDSTETQNGARNDVYAWPVDGKRFELPVPEGTVVRPASIIAAGTTVAGDVEAKDGAAWTVVWDLAEETAKPVEVSKLLDHVIDVNSAGMLVGTTTEHTPGLASVEGGDLKLPTLTGKPDEFSERAWAVNSDGTKVAGSSLNERGEPRAVIWSCS